MILNSPTISGSLTVTGNILTSGSITLSGSIASSSFASTASFVALAQSASNAVSAQTASFANAFTVAGNLTAQTLVVQTITSSVDFVTGSTRFGSLAANTHVFTGSMSVSGSGTFASSITATNGNFSVESSATNSVLDILTLTHTTSGTAASGLGAGILFRAERPSSGITLSRGAIYGVSGTDADDDGDLAFYTLKDTGASGFNEKMRITSAGNVGIGTSIPQSIFHIGAPAPANSGVKAYTGLANSYEGFLFDYYYNTAASNLRLFDIVALGASTTGIGGSDIRFLTVPQTTTGTPLERLRITNSGNVGIGTTNPSQLFEVVGGEIKAGRIDSSIEGGQVSFGRSTDNATTWYIDAYGNSSSTQLRFVNVSNSVVAMTLTGSYVGIGTSSPSNPLHLVNANHYQFKIQDSAASMLFGADDSTMIGIEMANSAGATWFIGPHDPGTSGIQDRLTIGRLSGTWSYPAKFSSGGNLTILGTLTQNASDIRLKDNIENIPNALNKILSLNGFIFNWNELASNLGPYSTDTKQVGVSAQEIQSVLPEAVFLAPFDVDSFDDNKSKSGENYLTVQYDKIIPLLIEGIKELKAQNDDLQSQINELKAQ